MTVLTSHSGAVRAARAELPVFFLSHADPPAVDAEFVDDDDVDEMFTKFFRDLTDAVAARSALPSLSDIGYMVDAEASPAKTAHALAVCQVFVPLWSPLYFKSPGCGREWAAFQTRVPAGLNAVCFEPVTWAPVSAAAIPRAALAVDRGGRREARPDAEKGLYALMIDDEVEQYARVVDDVATAISRLAKSPVLDSVPAVDLSGTRSAFAPRRSRITLRVALLAPTADRLPESRQGSGRYGPRQLDWTPFGADWNRTLAEDVKQFAERLGYDVDVVGFDDIASELSAGGSPQKPTLLLIDNWALLDPLWRGEVEEYLKLRYPWYTFMVVRDPQDPETSRHVQPLRAVVDETLGARLTAMRIDLRHAASGNGSREQFQHDFSVLAQVAALSFLKR
jgi:FxsC-like protein